MTRTPQEIAHEMAQAACGPIEDFGALINDDGRDKLFQQLVHRLTADAGETCGSEQEDQIIELFRERLGGDFETWLAYDNQRATGAVIREASDDGEAWSAAGEAGPEDVKLDQAFVSIVQAALDGGGQPVDPK